MGKISYMKYCAKCGNELMDEAVICTKCGCMVERINATAPVEKSKLNSVSSDKKTNGSWIPLVFGILALVNAFLSVLSVITPTFFWYYVVSNLDFLGTSACPLLGVVTSIKYFKGENRVNPILGLIFSCMSVAVNLIIFITRIL